MWMRRSSKHFRTGHGGEGYEQFFFQRAFRPFLAFFGESIFPSLGDYKSTQKVPNIIGNQPKVIIL